MHLTQMVQPEWKCVGETLNKTRKTPQIKALKADRETGRKKRKQLRRQTSRFRHQRRINPQVVSDTKVDVEEAGGYMHRQAGRQADRAPSQRVGETGRWVTAVECSHAGRGSLLQKNRRPLGQIYRDGTCLQHSACTAPHQKPRHARTQQHGARAAIYKTEALFLMSHQTTWREQADLRVVSVLLNPYCCD